MEAKKTGAAATKTNLNHPKIVTVEILRQMPMECEY